MNVSRRRRIPYLLLSLLNGRLSDTHHILPLSYASHAQMEEETRSELHTIRGLLVSVTAGVAVPDATTTCEQALHAVARFLTKRWEQLDESDAAFLLRLFLRAVPAKPTLMMHYYIACSINHITYIVDGSTCLTTGVLQHLKNALRACAHDYHIRIPAFQALHMIAHDESGRDAVLRSLLWVPSATHSCDFIQQSGLLRFIADPKAFDKPLGRIWHDAVVKAACFMVEHSDREVVLLCSIAAIECIADVEEVMQTAANKKVADATRRDHSTVCGTRVSMALMRKYHCSSATERVRSEILKALIQISYGNGSTDIYRSDGIAWATDAMKREPSRSNVRSLHTILNNLALDNGPEAIHAIAASPVMGTMIQDAATCTDPKLADHKQFFWIIEAIVGFGTQEDIELIGTYKHSAEMFRRFVGHAEKTMKADELSLARSKLACVRVA